VGGHFPPPLPTPPAEEHPRCKLAVKSCRPRFCPKPLRAARPRGRCGARLYAPMSEASARRLSTTSWLPSLIWDPAVGVYPVRGRGCSHTRPSRRLSRVRPQRCPSPAARRPLPHSPLPPPLGSRTVIQALVPLVPATVEDQEVWLAVRAPSFWFEPGGTNHEQPLSGAAVTTGAPPGPAGLLFTTMWKGARPRYAFLRFFRARPMALPARPRSAMEAGSGTHSVRMWMWSIPA